MHRKQNLNILSMINRKIIALLLSLVAICSSAEARKRLCIDDGWDFSLGHASDPAADFGCGTEYFNYLTKAASIHNEGPYSPKFDKSKWGKEWEKVDLPHDWAVDLPFDSLASHSHGYKTIGYKYPENSVGWYRKLIEIKPEDRGSHFSICFDGIFRNAQVWVNGFYLGNEPSGYVPQIYDITEYLNYGGENLITVRVDASLEEGWFYEGAGIYRHVWLDKSDPVHVAPYGTFVTSDISPDRKHAEISIECKVSNKSNTPAAYSLSHEIISPSGETVAKISAPGRELAAKECASTTAKTVISAPVLWDIDNPAMYRILTSVIVNDSVVDTYLTKTGFRSIAFDPEKGFILNGRSVKFKGFNMHQDHPGVGTAIPDALQVFRLKELKKLGANAYRSSHNPMTPEMLDACDSLGMLVIEENRLMGINDYHLRQMKTMMERDRNHPSVILWSAGNEEWGIEWKEQGEYIAESMREYMHRIDPSRPMSVATSSGPNVIVPVDVAGYNYIMQNPIDSHKEQYPGRKAVGTEETTGCGTRGIYFDEPEKGHMMSLNRGMDRHDGSYNVIERGWKFYDERPWLGGVFYWTGFDYRGEPNPLKFPATGSQFGVLDYCGFPKDEAYYIKSWWTDEPVLHIFPHWNLEGHEGEPVSVWAYSNADEVELFVNGKSAGRKPMPENGHLEWSVTYKPGNIKAIGYKDGKKIATAVRETTGKPAAIVLSADRQTISADGRDVAVIEIKLCDSRGRFVPDACLPVTLKIEGPGRILGVGNGDSAFRAPERPADPSSREFTVDTFNGLAQVIIQSDKTPGEIILNAESPGLKPAAVSISGIPAL